MVKNDMNKIVQSILKRREEKYKFRQEQIKYHRKYKDYLGMVQQAERDIQDMLKDLEQFRQ